MADHAPSVSPLVLGHGPTELEIFLEPTCPFSARAFEKLPALLADVGSDRLTIRIHMLSQPWHLYSGVVCKGILAASTFPDGTALALKVMAGVFADRDAFEFEAHCSGPNMHRTPTDILAALSEIAGTDLGEAFCLRAVDRALRRYTRYARQVGAHESPTFMVDRLIAPKMSSGQSVAEWRNALGL